MDEVTYSSFTPWPGTNAIQRIAFTASGHDPLSWSAGAPSPGSLTPANTDTDGDGMPDAWEVIYGLNPHDPADARLDSDGDGVSNLDEFRTQTNPRDAGSNLRLNVDIGNPGNVTLQFVVEANKGYLLQQSRSLLPDSWETFRVLDPPNSRQTFTVQDPVSGAEKFYRVIRTP
jgi:hypothetical protein